MSASSLHFQPHLSQSAVPELARLRSLEVARVQVEKDLLSECNEVGMKHARLLANVLARASIV